MAGLLDTIIQGILLGGLYALFAAETQDVVAQVCELAGIPAQRLTSDVRARMPV